MSTFVFMNVCAHGWVWVYLPMHKVQKKALDPLELQWWVPVEPQLVTQVLGSKVWPFSMTAQPGFWTDELSLHPLLLLYKRALTHTPPWSVWYPSGTQTGWLSWAHVYTYENASSERQSSHCGSLLLNDTGREPCMLLLQNHEGVVIKP